MEYLVTALIGLQIGITLTAIYFCFKIMNNAFTPSLSYIFFGIGLLLQLIRIIQIISNVNGFLTVFAPYTILINLAMSLFFMLGFAQIYTLVNLIKND